MAKSSSGDERIINHFGAVRMRVTGSGNLRMTLLSLDDVQSKELLPLALSSTTNIEPNRICNFTQQRARLRIYTTDIDETFEISKIIVFVKPVAKSYPE